MAKKVLVVTDYAGNLHITPVGNKAFYQGRNKTIKDKQFKFRENMDEEEAMEFVTKHKGNDPEHITAIKAISVIADKDKQIADLQTQLAALLEDKSPVKPAETAVELIAKIKAATTVEEATALLVPGEERKTVLDELSKKVSQLATV